MASTFVDNYTLVDTINAQLPSATQYNSNQGDAVLTTDSYAPTSDSVHTIPTALRLLATGALTDDGYSQKSLYEILLMINVNWDNAMKQLDDSSLGTSNYEISHAVGALDGDYSTDSATSFAASTTALDLGLGQERAVNIFPSGVGTRELAIMCQAIASSLASCNAMLDADSTITDTDYASTLDIDFTSKTAWIPPTGTAVPFNITHPDAVGPNPISKIRDTGVGQEAIIDFLNSAVTNLNALWVKLDADI